MVVVVAGQELRSRRTKRVLATRGLLEAPTLKRNELVDYHHAALSPTLESNTYYLLGY
jgi:hypothetical protein